MYVRIGGLLLKLFYLTKQVQVFFRFFLLLIPNMDNLRYTITAAVEHFYVNPQSKRKENIPNLANNGDIIEQYYEPACWTLSLSSSSITRHHIPAIYQPEPLWLFECLARV